MLPLCSRRGGNVLRDVHDFDDAGACRFCGERREDRIPELERWRAALAVPSPGFEEHMQRAPAGPTAPRRPEPGLQVEAHGTGGRISDELHDRIREMLRRGFGINRTARECGVSRQAVRRRAEELEDERARELERRTRVVNEALERERKAKAAPRGAIMRTAKASRRSRR